MYAINLFIFSLALTLNSSFVLANEVTGPIDSLVLEQLQKLLDVPEDKVDFAYSKLSIDHIIDSRIDIQQQMDRLESITQEVNGMGSLTTSLEKKDALRRYIYDSGSWNESKPFTYDFDDPLGTNITNKLLPNYLTSREGNCVSMPILFIVMGQKLGLDVTASTAPLHVFVKFTDDLTNQTYNLETTSGAKPARDEWYRQNFQITDQALANGVYLQKLTRQETVAVMATSLLQHYSEQKQYGQVIATADLILKTYPKSVSAIVYKSSAYNDLLKQHDLWQYRTPRDVPEDKRELFKYLITHVNGYFNQAMQLGWRPSSQEQDDTYLNKVKEDSARK